MSDSRLSTVRAYWEASERGDWPAAGRCIGPGYTWIDRATGVEARTPEDLIAAREDASAWSGTQIVINEAFETDAALIVRATHSADVNGLWRGIEAAGQHITYEACTIFKFDAEDRIVFEEKYYDMSAISQQLLQVPPMT